jgi:hypothetical protein
MTATVVSVSQTARGSADLDKTTLSYTDAYLVKLSAADVDGDLIAISANGIPAMFAQGTTITGYSIPLVKKKSAQLLNSDSDHITYVVSVDYSNDSETQDASKKETEKAPWLRPWTYSCGKTAYERALTYDFSTTPKAVVNSCGDPFDPPLSVEYVRPNIKIQYASNVSFAPSTLSTYVNTVNSDTVTINGASFTAGKCRLTDWSVEKSFFEDSTTQPPTTTAYFDHTLEVELLAGHESSFDVSIVDQGYRHKVGGVLTRDKDGEGNNNPNPILLNGNGVKISDPINTAPSYITFRIYKQVAWSGLGLH